VPLPNVVAVVTGAFLGAETTKIPTVAFDRTYDPTDLTLFA